MVSAAEQISDQSNLGVPRFNTFNRISKTKNDPTIPLSEYTLTNCFCQYTYAKYSNIKKNLCTALRGTQVLRGFCLCFFIIIKVCHVDFRAFALAAVTAAATASAAAAVTAAASAGLVASVQRTGRKENQHSKYK